MTLQNNDSIINISVDEYFTLMPSEINDAIMSLCDMWTSYQLACSCRTFMSVFVSKLGYLARKDDRLAQVLYSVKLPRGFAEVINEYYFKPAIANNKTYLTVRMDAIFTAINGIEPTPALTTLTPNIDLNVLLNVKLSTEYKEQNIASISRVLFQLLNAGQTANVAAVVYLQRLTPAFNKRAVFGVFCEKLLFWLHPDVARDHNVDLRTVSTYTCRECMYGNFNHYDVELSANLNSQGNDTECLDHHIAYAYKYINYW